MTRSGGESEPKNVGILVGVQIQRTEEFEIKQYIIWIATGPFYFLIRTSVVPLFEIKFNYLHFDSLKRQCYLVQYAIR